MNAMSHEFDLAKAVMLPPARTGQWSAPGPDALQTQWQNVHEAAEAIGRLARLAPDVPSVQVLDLPRRAAELGERRYELVARGIDDLAAVLQPGLRALLALSAQGRDPTVAALTLAREFLTARQALVDLVETP